MTSLRAQERLIEGTIIQICETEKIVFNANNPQIDKHLRNAFFDFLHFRARDGEVRDVRRILTSLRAALMKDGLIEPKSPRRSRKKHNEKPGKYET